MNRRNRAPHSVWLAGLYLLCCAAWADETASARFQQQWLEPLAVALPAPTRSVLLDTGVDAAAWMAEAGIAGARLLPQGGNTLAQFEMADTQWTARREGLCTAPGVRACDEGLCRGIQMDARIDPVNDSHSLKARIVPNAPDVPEPAAAAGGQCARPAALPALAAEQGGALPDLDLQLVFDDRRASRSAAAAGPGAVAPAAATAPAAPQAPSDPYDFAAAATDALAFTLDVTSRLPGTAELSSVQVPADTTQYTLVVGEGCRAVRMPLDGAAPAHVPGLLVAVVAGDPAQLALRYGLTVISAQQLSSTGDQLVVFWSADPAPVMLPRLRADAGVLLADREHLFTTTAGEEYPAYSDPFAPFTYGPAQTGALSLHQQSTGSGETIAVIDTGVAADHPELQGRVRVQDFTGKGWSADAHGTAVAGIIAAAADNAVGPFGVAPAASILALKACQPVQPGALAARCWTSALVRALDAAMLADAQIINMSLAGPPDALLARYVEQAAAQGRLIVAGAGNGGPQARPAFPAAYPGVLAVTATDQLNRSYTQANRGDYIDLAAPGVDIVTLSAGEGFPTSSGTSWAAAHVSGIAAVLRPLLPDLQVSQFAGVLTGQTRDLGAPGKDPEFGFGLVDACAAAAQASAGTITCGVEQEVSHAGIR